MPSLLALAMPLALVLSATGSGGEIGPVGAPDTTGMSVAALDGDATGDGQRKRIPRLSPRPATSLSAAPLDIFRGDQNVRQIRIERRMIVRISPRRPRNRNELLAQLPQQEVATRFEEREMDNCLSVDRIAGVQTGSGNRLLLFMRDRGIISVNLEKACRARDFYSGFYVEQNDDGKLCVDRDRLQSRSGATCEVERMRRLVAVKE